jgi:hypothetical protein
MNHQFDPFSSAAASRRRKMIEHFAEACRLAALEGIPNLLRGPGLVQQLVVSDALGHVPCLSWHDGSGDAYAANDPSQRFEYFTALEGRRFQTGSAGAGGRKSRDQLRERFLAAGKIYLAVFDGKEPLKLLRIYEVEPGVIWEEAARQIDKSANARANVTVSERWAAEHGRRIVPGAALDEDRSRSSPKN